MSANSLPDYLTFWGKTKTDDDGRLFWHPAVYHMLDVAAVAEIILDATRPRIRWLAERFSVDPEALAANALLFIALHDLGKMTTGFQAQVKELWPSALGPAPAQYHGERHWQLTFDLLMKDPLHRCVKVQIPGAYPDEIKQIVAAIAGHHGRPPDCDTSRDRMPAIGAALLPVIDAFVEDLIRLFETPCLENMPEQAFPVVSWWLAGLTTLADWIGSKSDWFPVEQPFGQMPTKDIAAYWTQVARPRAAEAVQAAGILRKSVNPASGYKSLFGEMTPRPMQAAAEAVVLPDAPALVIIEDATGSGKTEAAVILAHRLMAAGRGDGVFFAMPTMATANAMFERMRQAYRRLFSADDPSLPVPGFLPSLVLAHSRRDLHEGFSELRLAGMSGIDSGNGEQEPSVAASCAEWIADDRRRAFFADVGVGTIDQALLGVLPTKFHALRLAGLLGRILVVDEAHAYDTYVGTELERLLEFHAALGGSAIVLSATLPKARRATLARAFAGAKNLAIENSSYPLLTVVANDGSIAKEQKVEAAPHSTRSVAIERTDSVESAMREVLEAASKGAAVAWIRNAVDDAIAATDLLRAENADVDLFHARFAMVDRQKIEDRIVARFGKRGPAEDRRGRIVVATQVIEQSLDLDFDLIVSDLAPVDLLIQRAGRLWRHMTERPVAMRPIPGPRLVLLAPDPDDVSDEKWLSRVIDKGCFVYQDHAVLWRSLKVLLDAGEIRSPDCLRGLVESAYDENANAPEPLQRSAEKARGAAYGDRQQAVSNLLEFKGGYLAAHGQFDDLHYPTRLGDEKSTIRLARLNADGVLQPWGAGEGIDDVRAWALSEIAVKEGWAQAIRNAEEKSPAIEKLKEAWPKWQRTLPVGIVQQDGRLAGMSEVSLSYNPDRGLC